MKIYKKIKVALAAQRFSSSVAYALEFLGKVIRHEQFLDCIGTVLNDRLFEILKSSLSFGNGTAQYC